MTIKLAKINEHTSTLDTSVLKLHDTIKQYQVKIEVINAEYALLSQELASANRLNKELMDQVDSQKTLIESKNDEIEELSSVIKEIEEKIEGIEKEIAEKEREKERAFKREL